MPYENRVQSRQHAAGLSSCLISSIAFVILTSLFFLFATSTLRQASIRGQALAAAIFDLLALSAFLIFSFVHFVSNSALSWTIPRRWLVASCVVLPSGIAFVLSIYVLGWMHKQIPRLEKARGSSNISTLMGGALAMWIIALVSQMLFFFLCFRQTHSSHTVISSSAIGVYSVESAVKEHPPVGMASFSPPSYPRSAPDSPTMSALTVSPMASVRSSVTQFLRPVTSKSRLIPPRKDSFSKDAASIISEVAAEPIRQEDGFELWEVDPKSDPLDAASSAPCATNRRLETIPGSRPVSPAHPLDGPFPSDPAPPEDIPLPESPPRMLPKFPSQSRLDARLDSLDPLKIPAVFEGMTPSPILTNSSPTARSFTPPFATGTMPRRPSLPNDQSHIHPLFRTDSPTPPPAASRGTILTASPWGGQVLPVDSDHPLSPRSRKNSTFSYNGDNSRSSSPVASIRPGSARGVARACSPLVTSPHSSSFPAVWRSCSQGDLRSRSELDRRTPTPPMPEPVFLHRRQASS